VAPHLGSPGRKGGVEGSDDDAHRYAEGVALVAEPDPEGGGPGRGNLVLLASRRPLPDAVRSRSRGARTYGRAELARLAAGADPLTDDDAPADQLLSPG
jgi:hypothetical protein